MINKKLEKLVEEIISSQAAAKPVATKEGKGEISTPSMTNATVYPSDQHKQAEEVKEVIVEQVVGVEPEEQEEASVEQAADEGEYDYEGDMAKSQLRIIADAAAEIHNMLEDNENLPEWVQSKITLAADYVTNARDYLKSEKMEDHMGDDEQIEVDYSPEIKGLMESFGFKDTKGGLDRLSDYLAYKTLSEMAIYGKKPEDLAAMQDPEFREFLATYVLKGQVNPEKIRHQSPETWNKLLKMTFAKAAEVPNYETTVYPYLGKFSDKNTALLMKNPQASGLTVKFQPQVKSDSSGDELENFLNPNHATEEEVTTPEVTTNVVDSLKSKLVPMSEAISPKNRVGRPSNKSLRLKVKGGHVMNNEGKIVPFSQLKKGKGEKHETNN
jgi:hypothetical protein